MEVQATRVAGWDDLNKPGDFYIAEEKDHHRIFFYCPCGTCTRMFVCSIPIKVGPKEEKFWEWDGNIFKPTITHGDIPEYRCEWHGYLTNGVFKNV